MNTPTPNTPADRGEPVTGDATCRNCKYPLAGLFIGGNCPECGTTIIGEPNAATTRRNEPESLGKPLIEGPYWYLRLLYAAFWMMTIAWAFVPLTLLLSLFGLDFITDAIPASVLYVLLGLCWSGGVLMTLRNRPDSIRGKRNGVPIREYPRLRLVVALAQIPIVLAPLMGLLATHAANPAPFFASSLIFSVAATIGYIPTALYLAQIADWASDAELAGKIRAFGWLIGLGLVGSLFIYLSIELQGVLPILPVLASLFWLITLVLTVVSTVLLATSTLRLIGMTHWLIRNKAKHEEREIRRAEKAARAAQEHQQRNAEFGPAPVGAPPIDKHLYDSVIQKHEKSEDESQHDQDRARKQKFTNEQRLEKSGENPYGLEEND